MQAWLGLHGCTGVAWDVTGIGTGHSFEKWAWQEQLEPGSSGLPVLQAQWMWAACAVQVGAVQVVPLRSSVLLEPAVWQGAPWDSVDHFDTTFTKVFLHAAVCGTIAGAYLIAVLW